MQFQRNIRMLKNWICKNKYFPMRILIIFLFTIILSNSLLGQKNDQFILNGSFEGVNSNLRNWIFTAELKRNTPNLLYTEGNFWHIKHIPQAGVSYVLLVVRDDGTYESLNQKLKSPLVAGEDYVVSLYLSHSLEMRSMSMNSGNLQVPFKTPAILKFFGGSSFKNRELLFKSVPVENEDWRYYEFIITPIKKYKKIWIEAYFSDEKRDPYNGNLLIDNLSISKKN